MENNKIERVPIHLKLALTSKEAAEYSNIGINKIDSMLRAPKCPFVLFVGTKPLGKRKECKKVFLELDDDYSGSTIRQAYITMGTMLKAAKMNDLISKHPMDGVRFTKPVRAANDIKFLTREEQRIFLETARRSHNYNQYALILETGLRTGELIAQACAAGDVELRTL